MLCHHDSPSRRFAHLQFPPNTNSLDCHRSFFARRLRFADAGKSVISLFQFPQESHISHLPVHRTEDCVMLIRRSDFADRLTFLVRFHVCGLWHPWQWCGHPCVKTVRRTPSPSTMLSSTIPAILIFMMSPHQQMSSVACQTPPIYPVGRNRKPSF